MLSPEQQYAFEKFKRGENLFITGPGGTGKTKLIEHFVEYANLAGKKIQVCALTGCAAILLGKSAKTIHSWSGIKLARGTPESVVANVLKNRFAQREWKSVKILIIDEISMMSRKIFEILNEVGQRMRRNPFPFGGIQVIFTGDFFQLPPVGTDGEPETQHFCFESPLWKDVFPLKNHIQLEHIFRQTDPVYIKILKETRLGALEPESIEILEKYVSRKYDSEKNNGCVPTKLFPIRNKVDRLNHNEFEKIDDVEYHFECSIRSDCTVYHDSGKKFTTEHFIKCQKMSEKEKDYEIEYLLNNTPCGRLLKLKKGSAVLCTVNLAIEQGICNGSQGIVTEMREMGDKIIPIVKFTNGVQLPIEPNYWQSEECPSIMVGQYPLTLAWALTIHKIQGATLDMAEIDIGTSIFEYGQTYVALSRIRSLEGLYLSCFNPERIKANPLVVEFYKTIPKLELPPPEDLVNTKKISFDKYKYVNKGETCDTCNGTGRSYWSDGIYGSCLECGSINGDSEEENATNENVKIIKLS